MPKIAKKFNIPEEKQRLIIEKEKRFSKKVSTKIPFRKIFQTDFNKRGCIRTKPKSRRFQFRYLWIACKHTFKNALNGGDGLLGLDRNSG
jgi:hypothetical protein